MRRVGRRRLWLMMLLLLLCATAVPGQDSGLIDEGPIEAGSPRGPVDDGYEQPRVDATEAPLGAPVEATQADEPGDEEVADQEGSAGIPYGVSLVRPWRGIRLGNLKATFFLASTLNYDDNIYLREDDEPAYDPSAGDDDDVRFITVPGARADLSIGNHVFSAEYRMEIVSYGEQEDQDQINNFYDVQARLRFNEVYLNVGNRLQTLSDPIDLASSKKVERMTRTTSVLAGMQHLRLTLELNYSHMYFDFEDESFNHIDHQEDYVTGYIAYQISPRWAVDFDYMYGERDFEENVISDSHVNRLRGGLDGYITPKLEISASVGFEEVTPEGGDLIDDDNDGHLVSTDLQASYRFTPRTTLMAAYARATQYSAMAAYDIVNDVQLSASHQLTDSVRVGGTVWYRDQDPSRGARRQQWGVRFGADWQIRPYWSVSAEGLFRFQEAVELDDPMVYRFGDNIFGPGLLMSQDFANAQFLLSTIFSY